MNARAEKLHRSYRVCSHHFLSKKLRDWTDILQTETQRFLVCWAFTDFSSDILSDGTLRIWNASKKLQPSVTIRASEGEVIATAGTDAAFHDWDSRQPGQAVFNLKNRDHKLPSPCLKVMDNHAEFVCGPGFSNHVEGLMADCACDYTVGIYNLGKPFKAPQQPS